MTSRFKRRRVLNRPKFRMLSLTALFAFAIFVSFKIFMAPVKTVQVVPAPAGNRTARLQHVYYYATPGIKISVREKYIWRTLAYLPEFTNTVEAAGATSLQWSSDSRRLTLEVTGTPVWEKRFDQ
ncbi:MAG: hypothetical protein WC959_04180 [Kiritimatiellales bacterium]